MKVLTLRRRDAKSNSLILFNLVNPVKNTASVFIFNAEAQKHKYFVAAWELNCEMRLRCGTVLYRFGSEKKVDFFLIKG